MLRYPYIEVTAPHKLSKETAVVKRNTTTPIVKRHITLPADLTAMVENELHDTARQKRAYGTFSALIEELLRQWIGNIERTRTASSLKPLESLLPHD